MRSSPLQPGPLLLIRDTTERHRTTDLAVGGSNSRRATITAAQRRYNGAAVGRRAARLRPIATTLAGSPEVTATTCDQVAAPGAIPPDHRRHGRRSHVPPDRSRRRGCCCSQVDPTHTECLPLHSTDQGRSAAQDDQSPITAAPKNAHIMDSYNSRCLRQLSWPSSTSSRASCWNCSSWSRRRR
jgi:hypothetical protein